jgi:hypothetical protein
MTTQYVLYIEFANDPPRVAAFDSLDEAEAILDAFEVTVFDPPQNDGLDYTLLHARIFKCEGVSIPFDYKRGDCSGWGTEVDITEWRRRRSDDFVARMKAGEIISLADIVGGPSQQ